MILNCSGVKVETRTTFTIAIGELAQMNGIIAYGEYNSSTHAVTNQIYEADANTTVYLANNGLPLPNQDSQVVAITTNTQQTITATLIYSARRLRVWSFTMPSDDVTITVTNFL